MPKKPKSKSYVQIGSTIINVPPKMIGFDSQHHKHLYNTTTPHHNIAIHNGKPAIKFVRNIKSTRKISRVPYSTKYTTLDEPKKPRQPRQPRQVPQQNIIGLPPPPPPPPPRPQMQIQQQRVIAPVVIAQQPLAPPPPPQRPQIQILPQQRVVAPVIIPQQNDIQIAAINRIKASIKQQSARDDFDNQRFIAANQRDVAAMLAPPPPPPPPPQQELPVAINSIEKGRKLLEKLANPPRTYEQKRLQKGYIAYVLSNARESRERKQAVQNVKKKIMKDITTKAIASQMRRDIIDVDTKKRIKEYQQQYKKEQIAATIIQNAIKRKLQQQQPLPRQKPPVPIRPPRIAKSAPLPIARAPQTLDIINENLNPLEANWILGDSIKNKKARAILNNLRVEKSINNAAAITIQNAIRKKQAKDILNK